MEKLEEKLASRQKMDALAQSSVDNKKESIKAEQKKKKELNKNCDDVSWKHQ